jgi:hypothetical protein
MDDTGLTSRQAADQLGHSKVSMTQDNYFGRRVARTGAADLLEVFGVDDLDGNPGVFRGRSSVDRSGSAVTCEFVGPQGIEP